MALPLPAPADAEDEAQRAAACVIGTCERRALSRGFAGNDRLLDPARRRHAATASGAAVRDETGWKLSTTHAAAQLMALLRAADAAASMDEVLNAHEAVAALVG